MKQLVKQMVVWILRALAAIVLAPILLPIGVMVGFAILVINLFNFSSAMFVFIFEGKWNFRLEW
jgi:hypothetical protein